MEYIGVFITHPITITLWLILLGILIVVLEGKIRLNNTDKNHKKQKTKIYMFVQFVCIFLLATHILTIGITIIFFIQENAKIENRSDEISSEINSHSDGINVIFNEVFPHAERCHSLGIQNNDCSSEAIREQIYVNIPQQIIVPREMEFVRYAVDDRLEYLSPITGEFRSYTADHSPFGARFHKELQNRLSPDKKTKRNNMITELTNSVQQYFSYDFELGPSSIYPQIFFYTSKKNDEVQGVLTYARPGDTDIIFYRYNITILAMLFLTFGLFFQPISVYGLYSVTWIILVAIGYVVFRVQRQKKLSS